MYRSSLLGTKEQIAMSDDTDPELGDEASLKILDPAALRLAEFHSAEAEVMLLKYEAIEKLIGDGTHRASEGTYCEDLVREFLRKVLPSRYSVDTGFIRGKETQIGTKRRFVSQQIDVIVHDIIDFSPIFRSEGFVIVLPEAVASVIEVKKCLRPGELRDALWNLALARCLVHQSRPKQEANVFTAVFAFTSEDLSPESKRFSAAYATKLSEIGRQIVPMYSIPDMITVVDREILHRGPQDHLETAFGVRHRLSKLGGVSVACQALLCSLLFEMRAKEVSGEDWHRFSFPPGFAFNDVMKFWQPTKLLPPEGGDPTQDFSTIC
jgi:hypothetical protein